MRQTELETDILALYLRISEEDKDLNSNEQKGESNSISAQRKLLYHFLKSKPELHSFQIREFQDDGYSGTNLDRPALQQLLDLARKGYVKCIIVKDLSRFGRNYVETGNYIEQIFPFMGIRFIAVNDHFDSFNKPGQTPELDVAFKNILYDFYSKDLSTKVKSIKRLQQREGKFVAAKPPYGFLISKENRYKLLPDKATAKYVRLMFDMTLTGKFPSEIAEHLNQKKVPTPVQRNFYQFGFRDRWYNEETIDESYWTGFAVLKILKNPAMYGCTVNNRVQVKSIGSRSFKRQPEENFVIVPDTHDAIVDRETFVQVQEIIKSRTTVRRNVRRSNENLFGGKLFCGECNARLRHEVHYRASKEASYYCPHARFTKGAKCSRKSIKDECLEQIVFSVLEAHLKTVIEWKALSVKPLLPTISEQMDKWASEIEKLRVKIPQLYESYCNNCIEREEFLLKKEAIRDEITHLQSNIEKNEELLMAKEQSSENSAAEWLKLMKTGKDKPLLIDTFIESILLYPSGRLRIKLKGADEFRELNF